MPETLEARAEVHRDKVILARSIVTTYCPLT